MAFTISEENSRYLHVIWSGEISDDDLGRLRDEMFKRRIKLFWKRRILHTFDAVTSVSFKPIEALSHSMKRKQIRIPIRVRAASVAKTEMIQKHAALIRELNRNPFLRMETFSIEEEAIAWLETGKRR